MIGKDGAADTPPQPAFRSSSRITLRNVLSSGSRAAATCLCQHVVDALIAGSAGRVRLLAEPGERRVVQSDGDARFTRCAQENSGEAGLQIPALLV